jgi:hypothetical protein
MQSGHGKEYMESFGLLISNPLESLWDRIFSMCRLKLFQLWKRGNTKKINAYFCSMMSILNNQTCPVPVSSFSNHFRLAPHATQGQNQTHRC